MFTITARGGGYSTSDEYLFSMTPLPWFLGRCNIRRLAECSHGTGGARRKTSPPWHSGYPSTSSTQSGGESPHGRFGPSTPQHRLPCRTVIEIKHSNRGQSIPDLVVEYSHRRTEYEEEIQFQLSPCGQSPPCLAQERNMLAVRQNPSRKHVHLVHACGYLLRNHKLSEMGPGSSL